MEDVQIAELRDLSERECLALLANIDHGQLATTQRALPSIVPVRLRLVDDNVPVRLRLVDDNVIDVPLLGKNASLASATVVSIQAGPSGEGLASDWTVEVRGFLDPSCPSDTYPTERDALSAETFGVAVDHIRGWGAS
jgi:hypothetical protein